jgi:hypothetical protein
MANLTITKLANGNVEVTGSTSPYSLLPTMFVYRNNSNIDGVDLVSNGRVTDTISASNVLLITGGSGAINTPTGDQLYAELRDYFFNS